MKVVSRMENFSQPKNENLPEKINAYYSKKFYDLELEKLKSAYTKSITYLKNFPYIPALYNSNICIYDPYSGQYSFIKKEHFLDDLSDNEKESYFRKIKRFTDEVLKANQILNEWSEKLETYIKSSQEELKGIQNLPIYAWYSNAQCYFSKITSDAPKHLISTQPVFPNENLQGQLPSKDITDFLYQLCDGNIENFQNLAKLSYNLIYNPQEYLSTVIFANNKIHESLKDFFNLLIPPHRLNFPYELTWTDFNTMRLKDNRFHLLEHELKNDLPIILIKSDTIYKKGEAYSFFKKLFTGKNIPIDNPYFNEDLILKNSIPMICFTDDEKKYKTIKNLYNKIKSIEIRTTELNFSQKVFNSADWFRKEFLYIGKKEVTTNPEMSIPYEFNHEKIVQKFLRAYCTFGEGKKCTKQNLHSAYKEYFKHCYPDEKHLEQGKFCTKVKNLKGHRILAKRIHESKDSNPTYFLGMDLKENFSESYKDEPVYEHAKTEKEKFEITLNNLAKETFGIMQLNSRKVEKTIDTTLNNI